MQNTDNATSTELPLPLLHLLPLPDATRFHTPPTPCIPTKTTPSPRTRLLYIPTHQPVSDNAGNTTHQDEYKR